MARFPYHEAVFSAEWQSLLSIAKIRSLYFCGMDLGVETEGNIFRNYPRIVVNSGS